MKNFEVKSMIFGKGQTRIVSVENPAEDLNELLDQIYHYGQNDVQRRWTPSVSVGDIITINGDHHIVLKRGFEKLDFETFMTLIESKNEANHEEDHGAYSRIVFQKLGKESMLKYTC